MNEPLFYREYNGTRGKQSKSVPSHESGRITSDKRLITRGIIVNLEEISSQFIK